MFLFYLPMRQAEILNLTWEEIDLKMGFIRLGGMRSKTKVGRVIPLHPRIIEFLRSCPRPSHGDYVFANGRRFNRKAYNKSFEAAGIVDFNNHYLQLCAINNMRLAGNDHFVIQEVSGAKTDSAFQRYNLVTEQEMKGIKLLDIKSGKSGTMDTYMDTNTKIEIV
jgi:integrase